MGQATALWGLLRRGCVFRGHTVRLVGFLQCGLLHGFGSPSAARLTGRPLHWSFFLPGRKGHAAGLERGSFGLQVRRPSRSDTLVVVFSVCLLCLLQFPCEVLQPGPGAYSRPALLAAQRRGSAARFENCLSPNGAGATIRIRRCGLLQPCVLATALRPVPVLPNSLLCIRSVVASLSGVSCRAARGCTLSLRLPPSPLWRAFQPVWRSRCPG